MTNYFLLSIFLFFSISFLPAQQKDSLLQNYPNISPEIDSTGLIRQKDSLFLPDSTANLTTADTAKKKTYDVDSVIYSTASDSLIFFVNKKEMDIYGNGELKYKQTDLKSANIFVDFNTNNIEAKGVPSDSLLKS